MKETPLLHRISLAVSDHGARLFRNNTGQGWTGDAYVHRGPPRRIEIGNGDVLIRRARPLHAGLCVGSPDLAGWQQITVTPEMVGKRIAIFAGVEAKTGKLKLTVEQQAFQSAVNHAGGVAITAREDTDAAAEIKIQFLRNLAGQ